MNWLKENLLTVVLARLFGAILSCAILFVAYTIYTSLYWTNEIILIKPEAKQLVRLKELSKRDFRDVNHTMLMLADQYIEYNNEVKK